MNTASENWQRQSWLALPLRFVHFFQQTIFNVLPAVAGSAFLVKSDSKFYLILVILMILLIYIFNAVLHYIFFVYRIESDQILVKSGVLFKKSKTIRFERIQSVNTRQNLAHRNLGLVSVGIETAGSAQEEVRFYAIPYSIGQKFQQIVEKYNLTQDIETDLEENADEDDHSEKETILALNLIEIFQVALCLNPLIWIVSIFAAWGYLAENQMIFDFFQSRIEWFFNSVMPFASESKLVMGLIIIAFVFVGLLVAITLTVMWNILRFYDYKLVKKENELRNESGLFTRHSVVIQRSKIQLITCLSHPLRDYFGFYHCLLHQAGTHQDSKKLFTIPYWTDPEQLIRLCFGVEDSQEKQWLSIHKAYKKIQRRWHVWFATLIILLGAYFFNYFFFIFLLYPLSKWFLIIKDYNNRCYYIDQQTLGLRSGWLRQKLRFIQLHQVQQIKVRQSPFQRKHHLANLVLFSASGSLSIPFIEKQIAYQILNRLLLNIESSQKEWM